MFFIASKLLAFLSKPIIWIFFLVLSSLIFKNKRRKLLITSLVFFYFFSNEFIADEFSKLWQVPAKHINDIEKRYDYGVVLGGYSSYNQRTNQINFNESGDRLISAIELYKLGKIKKILISGGNGELINDGMRESAWSKDFLLNMGIDKADIILEDSSRNTMENAQYTARLLQEDHNTLLITSANHMKRATYCFKKQNIKHDTFPTDGIKNNITLHFGYLFIPDSKVLKQWESLIHEWIGYIVYRIKL
jgi:uncharacterized SAM-binding protein YcdF (DUF218 family)